jgi:hypothetical protein
LINKREKGRDEEGENEAGGGERKEEGDEE